MDHRILAAVSDATRFKLLKELLKGELCVCELPKRLGITQPAVSQHLKLLLGAGMVEMRAEGAKRIYSISKKGGKVMKDISRW